MVDYENLYLQLAGKLADTIDTLDELSEILKQAQQEY